MNPYFLSFDHEGNLKHKGVVTDTQRGDYLVELHPFKTGYPTKSAVVRGYDAADWETFLTEQEWHEAADHYINQFEVEGGNQNG